MKNPISYVLATFLVLIFIPIVHSQNVAINNDGSSPNPNAMLDIAAKDKVLLIPRFSTAIREEMNAGTKEIGLLVYDTDLNAFMFFNGSVWSSLGGGGVSGDAWSLSGNSATVNGIDFIGTTDAQDLDIRVNDMIRARVTQKGQIEILNTGGAIYIGRQAGENSSDQSNICIGYQSGSSDTCTWRYDPWC